MKYSIVLFTLIASQMGVLAAPVLTIPAKFQPVQISSLLRSAEPPGGQLQAQHPCYVKLDALVQASNQFVQLLNSLNEDTRFVKTRSPGQRLMINKATRYGIFANQEILDISNDRSSLQLTEPQMAILTNVVAETLNYIEAASPRLRLPGQQTDQMIKAATLTKTAKDEAFIECKFDFVPRKEKKVTHIGKIVTGVGKLLE